MVANSHLIWAAGPAPSLLVPAPVPVPVPERSHALPASAAEEGLQGRRAVGHRHQTASAGVAAGGRCPLVMGRRKWRGPGADQARGRGRAPRWVAARRGVPASRTSGAGLARRHLRRPRSERQRAAVGHGSPRGAAGQRRSRDPRERQGERQSPTIRGSRAGRRDCVWPPAGETRRAGAAGASSRCCGGVSRPGSSPDVVAPPILARDGRDRRDSACCRVFARRIVARSTDGGSAATRSLQTLRHDFVALCREKTVSKTRSTSIKKSNIYMPTITATMISEKRPDVLRVGGLVKCRGEETATFPRKRDHPLTSHQSQIDPSVIYGG